MVYLLILLAFLCLSIDCCMSLSLCVLLTPISFSLFLFSFLISFIAAFEGSGPARAAEITVLTSEVSCLLRGLTLTASDPK